MLADACHHIASSHCFGAGRRHAVLAAGIAGAVKRTGTPSGLPFHSALVAHGRMTNLDLNQKVYLSNQNCSRARVPTHTRVRV